jgi:hypothetical protein
VLLRFSNDFQWNHDGTDTTAAHVRTGQQKVRVRSKLRQTCDERSPVNPIYEGAVMDDPAAADIDTVVGKAKTRCNEV